MQMHYLAPNNKISQLHSSTTVLQFYSSTTVRAKGLATLIDYSFLHKDGDLMNYLEWEPEKVVVHIRCRKEFTKPRADVDRACDYSVQNLAKKLRSSTEIFSFKTDCFLCGENAVLDSRHSERNKQIHIAQTLGLKESIFTKCDERLDTWALEVKGRLQQCSDLPAADALHHGACYTRFYQGQKPPNTGEPPSIRQDHDDKYHTFHKMCDWFENCDELCILVDLRQHMLDSALLHFTQLHLWSGMACQPMSGHHLRFRPSRKCSKLIISAALPPRSRACPVPQIRFDWPTRTLSLRPWRVFQIVIIIIIIIRASDESKVYSVQSLKQKLSDHIFFGEHKGQRDIVCLRDMASFIINSKWYKDHKENVCEESERIILAAAKLIRA